MKRYLNWKSSLTLMFLLVSSLTFLFAATISGTITNETSQPFNNSRVQLVIPGQSGGSGGNGDCGDPNDDCGEIFQQTMTDSTGSYNFIDVPIGSYNVCARAEHYEKTFFTSPDTGEILIVEVDADEQEIVGINIQLVPDCDPPPPPPPPEAGEISGRVFNLDNVPIPHVLVGVVTLDNLNMPLPGLFEHTNMNGVYEICDIQPGVYKTCVIGPDNLPIAYSAEFTVVEDACIDSVDIIADIQPPVYEFGAVSGHVIGADMEPGQIINVGLVTLADLNTVLPDLNGHAGHMGNYCIEEVPAGFYKACVIGPDHVPVAYSDSFEVVVGQMTQNVDIIMGAYVGFSVSGTIYNSDSLPIQEGIVELRTVSGDNRHGNNHNHRTVHVNADGFYTFTNIPAGQYIISVWTEMSPVVFYPSTFDPEQATPIDVVDADIIGIDITIPVLQDYVISGFVKDALTEQPIAGIRVRTDRMGFRHFPSHDAMFDDEYSAITDASGFYSFTAPIGRYTIVANDSTHTYRHQFYYHANHPFDATVIFLDADRTDINFDLLPSADSLNYSISGVVTENGEAITYPVRVVAVSSDEDWEESTMSDHNGNYSLNHLFPGNYYVVAYSLYTPPLYYNNQLTWEAADLVTVNGQITGINFDLISTYSDGPSNLNGFISDGTGTVLDNVIVVITNSANQVIGFSRTNELGQYSVSNVPAESFNVIATKLGYATVTQPVSLSGTQIADFIMQAPTANDDSVTPGIPAMITNYPNPFNPNTNILFTAPKDSQVSVKIFNIKGQCIKNLLNTNVKAGNHVLTWDGTDNNGNGVTSGIYMVSMRGNGFSTNHKMTLMK
jgi:hypothetical protein